MWKLVEFPNTSVLQYFLPIAVKIFTHCWSNIYCTASLGTLMNSDYLSLV